MYPFVRLIKELIVHRNAPKLPLTGTHVSHHIIWPWDLDGFMELNNGRTLTLYDLGRFGASGRVGLDRLLKENRWGLTVAGSSVRYRRRVTLFQRVEMRTRAIGWDDRFVYLEQSMWNSLGEGTSHMLIRTGVVRKGGLVPTTEVLAALNYEGPPPILPEWVKAWIAAEAKRPWPPMQHTVGPQGD